MLLAIGPSSPLTDDASVPTMLPSLGVPKLSLAFFPIEQSGLAYTRLLISDGIALGQLTMFKIINDAYIIFFV